MRCITRLLSFAVPFALVPLSHAENYATIERLPDEMSGLMKRFHEQADTGVTAKMEQATIALNEEIRQMMWKLVAEYYTNKSVSYDLVRRYYQDIENTLIAEQELHNPSGENRGSLAALDVPSALSEKLTSRIASMVASITQGNSEFDLRAWKKKRERACDPGN